jgi:hypothetical protein
MGTAWTEDEDVALALWALGYVVVGGESHNG